MSDSIEKIVYILGKNHTDPIAFKSVNNYKEVYGLYTYKGGVFVFKEGMDIDFKELTKKEQIKVLDMVERNDWVVNKSLQ